MTNTQYRKLVFFWRHGTLPFLYRCTVPHFSNCQFKPVFRKLQFILPVLEAGDAATVMIKYNNKTFYQTDKNCKSKTGKEIVKEAQASPFQSATDGSTLVTVHLKPGAKFDEIINVGEVSLIFSMTVIPSPNFNAFSFLQPQSSMFL